MGQRRIEYEPLRGELAFRALANAPDGTSAPVAMQGANLREGLLACLWRAELLAAQAGIVPFFEVNPGEKGVAIIGAARDKIHQADEGVRLVYLACHSAARRASAFARPAKDETPRIDSPEGFVRSATARLIQPTQLAVIQIPVLIVLTVIGVAAIVSGAWYAVKAKERDAQVEADKARAVASSGALADLAKAQLASTGKIDPDLIEGLADIGRREERAQWLAPVALGATGTVILGGAAYAALRRRRRAA